MSYDLPKRVEQYKGDASVVSWSTLVSLLILDNCKKISRDKPTDLYFYPEKHRNTIQMAENHLLVQKLHHHKP